MLVSTLPPPIFSTQHGQDDYRPSKDMDAFNNLLPPPIEFVEGSSSGTLAVAEGKYEPINASPKPAKAEPADISKKIPSTPAKATPAPPRSTGVKTTSMYPAAIDTSWPMSCSLGSGLYNSGNTCFLNSALQCLLHTPPLLRLLILHKKEDCRLSSSFCMACSLRLVATKAHVGNRSAFSPFPITNNLQHIAKHLRKGRQEDSHEFLRYAIDALQRSCLAGLPPKIDPKLAETTWVHKIFGGRLRSRVTCRSCGYNSDTFDRILDLSLDIFRCDSLKDALRKFIAIDYLKGSDKYKCEKCQKHVNAEKNFTIHEAPLVLTVHLKRFSPLGKKISHPLSYDQELSLQPYMSDGQFGPTYSLYGVICHAGGGPNSGHYYAFVKSREGRWAEMNDESVSSTSLPTDKRNAYMLFYIQNRGQGLEAAVKAPLANKMLSSSASMKNGLTNGVKKVERTSSSDEDQGVKISAPFIGPLLPSAEISVNVANLTPNPPTDPQAANLKSRIQAAAKAKASSALESLGNYDSEESDNDKESSASWKTQDKMDVDVKGKENDSGQGSTNPDLSAMPPTVESAKAIPASKFYSNTPSNAKKRKMSDSTSENFRVPSSPLQARTKGYHSKSVNPFSHAYNAKRRRRSGI
ncbi:Ubiquitin carboxyl-terminal hydrolase 36 [Psilocybe cubensis]|uniref:Ubiquitin carboxyl-terminal hydrolase 36 n=2 Tax=Psilocybe cubensis TaxID=181762 RepID=A0ACB8H4C7_PSICU|nr:Ubiquitin carboxyl-terminal hydrolase 36 [Psilocybe cubensis]KAH9482542.1 Ubiquitin carboxyl-terminal hydrolase 36 [Psilocybe cubensis]